MEMEVFSVVSGKSAEFLSAKKLNPRLVLSAKELNPRLVAASKKKERNSRDFRARGVVGDLAERDVRGGAGHDGEVRVLAAGGHHAVRGAVRPLPAHVPVLPERKQSLIFK